MLQSSGDQNITDISGLTTTTNDYKTVRFPNSPLGLDSIKFLQLKLSKFKNRYWLSYIYFIVLGDENVPTNTFGQPDSVAKSKHSSLTSPSKIKRMHVNFWYNSTWHTKSRRSCTWHFWACTWLQVAACIHWCQPRASQPPGRIQGAHGAVVLALVPFWIVVICNIKWLKK